MAAVLAGTRIRLEVRSMRKLRLGGFFLALLSFVLLVASAQAATARPQPTRVKQTAKPLLTLAMDGPRVAYMTNDRRVVVWNAVTGATSVIKGNYRTKGAGFGFGSGEVAIAGKRVALITRFVIGNTWQTQERLYTAPVGGSARQLGKLTNHLSYYGECPGSDIGGSSGDWLGGLVGAGNTLAVSTWRSNDLVTGAERLRLVTRTGLRTIVTGPGAVVSQSTSGGHIAVLRSTEAWPAYQGPAAASTPMVGIYSTHGRLLSEIMLNIPLPDPCGYTTTPVVRIALQGNRLVVLRLDVPKAGPRTSAVEVYDWRTGALSQTWPLTLGHSSPNQLAVSGRFAVIQGSSKLQVLDLTTGRQAAVGASRPNSPATIGSRGLVYAINPYRDTHPAKLVYVPTARLLGMVH